MLNSYREHTSYRLTKSPALSPLSKSGPVVLIKKRFDLQFLNF